MDEEPGPRSDYSSGHRCYRPPFTEDETAPADEALSQRAPDLIHEESDDDDVPLRDEDDELEFDDEAEIIIVTDVTAITILLAATAASLCPRPAFSGLTTKNFQFRIEICGCIVLMIQGTKRAWTMTTTLAASTAFLGYHVVADVKYRVKLVFRLMAIIRKKD